MKIEPYENVKPRERDLYHGDALTSVTAECYRLRGLLDELCASVKDRLGSMDYYFGPNARTAVSGESIKAFNRIVAALGACDAERDAGRMSATTPRREQSCATCKGNGYVVRPPTAYDLRVGESRRMHDPCPECDPVVGARRKGASDER